MVGHTVVLSQQRQKRISRELGMPSAHAPKPRRRASRSTSRWKRGVCLGVSRAPWAATSPGKRSRVKSSKAGKRTGPVDGN